jgi:hypothetical protein
VTNPVKSANGASQSLAIPFGSAQLQTPQLKNYDLAVRSPTVNFNVDGASAQKVNKWSFLNKI